MDEKSIQVQRMQDIYRNAKRVIVWVGEATDHTEMAFKVVERVLDCPNVEAQEAIWNESSEAIGCLNELIKRPYWTRAWIVQEVVLARTALLCCGSYSMPFFDLARFLIQPTTKKHIKVEYALSSYLELVFDMRRSSYEDPPLGLFELAYKPRYRQSTVPHDKLYAFLGLLKSKEAILSRKFSVNYNMNVDELWMAFAKETMSRYKTLLPLVLAENTDFPHARWCYDWLRRSYEPNSKDQNRILFWTGGLDNLNYYPLQLPHSAAAGLPARVQVDLGAPSVISAQGFSVSSVVRTGTSVSSLLLGFGRPNYVQLFQEWESLVGGPWEDSDMVRKFARTVTGGAWTAEPSDWRAWNNKDYSEKPWSWAWITTESHKVYGSTTGYEMNRHVDLKEHTVNASYNRIRDDACEGRRMLLLENGDFGLGPESAKVGDQVVILLGSQVPLVLRKRDHSGIRRLVDLENKAKLFKFTWKLVGQVYVDNLMQYRGDLEQDIEDGRVVLREYLLD
ncbi:hypothetical protein BGZ63DRAFT_95441 [Mariannaea sp. PMI_226]|nr:hypothetical protein BGZ63DRAFT_95441 [Mariannaea sp. PMI_226]